MRDLEVNIAWKEAGAKAPGLHNCKVLKEWREVQCGHKGVNRHGGYGGAISEMGREGGGVVPEEGSQEVRCQTCCRF